LANKKVHRALVEINVSGVFEASRSVDRSASQPACHIAVYPLRFEPQALRVYTPMWPTSLSHASSSIHYLFLLRGSKAVGRVTEFHV